MKQWDTQSTYTPEGGTYISMRATLPYPLKLALESLNASHEEEFNPHVTLMYDRNFTDLSAVNLITRAVFRGRIDKYEFWDGHDNDGYFVAKIECPQLIQRHQFWRGQGFTHSFDDYTPHVTFGIRQAAHFLRSHMSSQLTSYIGSPVLLSMESIEDIRSKN